jgi:hypothetical protein
MKMRLSELRGHLRSVLAEAPLADLDVTAEPLSLKTDKSKVQKFFGSKGFETEAKRVFGFLKTPVYLITVEQNASLSSRRAVFYGEHLRSVLQGTDISDERIASLEQKIDEGASVIVATANELRAGFQPTPWMIIHAMFDNEASQMPSFVNKLYHVLTRARFDIRPYLTMRSARDGKIPDSDSDVASEIATQAIATTSGFQFKQSHDEKINVTLKSIQEIMKDARSQFDDWISGKVIVINVASF